MNWHKKLAKELGRPPAEMGDVSLVELLEEFDALDWGAEDVVRLVEMYVNAGGGSEDPAVEAAAVRRVAWMREWITDEGADNERLEWFVGLLSSEATVDLVAELRRRLACETCGAVREFATGIGGLGGGRAFVAGCPACQRAAELARLDTWRHEAVESWRRSPGVEVGDVHWRAQGVELLPALEHLLTDDDERWGAFLYGDAGTGKTQQSVELVRSLFGQRAARYGVGDADRFGWQPPGQSGLLYVTEPALLASLRPGGGRSLEEYTGVDLLVLDDLGTASPTPWAAEQISALFDARYRDRRRTLITSNLTLTEMHAGTGAYGPRAMRRIYDMCGGRRAQEKGNLAVLRMGNNYSLPEGW